MLEQDKQAKPKAANLTDAPSKEKKETPAKVSVTFTKPWSRYSRGDIASFSAKEAERLVSGVKVAFETDAKKQIK